MAEAMLLSEPAESWPPPARRAWWRDAEVLVLALLVAGIYLTRLTDLSLRGEETRRGRIAWEMLDTGDFLVPREQGVPRLTRPPLQYWAIALTGAAWGRIDAVAVRLPSFVATLLTVLLIYGYGRTFLSRLGAFGAAAAFATMGQVLELARLGETEAVFTGLLSASLLMWHWGYCRGWPAAWTWTLGYALAALATLAKGPQGPVYFVGGVGAFLLVRREWRFALTRAHLIGLAVGIALVAAWQVPFMWKLSADHVSTTYTQEIGKRFVDTRWTAFLEHLAVYPLQIAFGCLMPWSLLLTVYADRRFRALLGAAWPHVAFLTVCVAVAFPPVWIPPQSNTRYFMPMYPCLALLVGLVIDRICRPAADWNEARYWRRFVLGAGVAMPVAGLAVLGLSFAKPGTAFAQPPAFAVAYALLGMAAGGVLVWSWRRRTAGRAQVAVATIAAFLGLSYTGVALNVMIHTSEDAAAAVAQLERTLPEDARLCSFDGLNPDGVNHVFAFFYQRPIPRQPWPRTAADVPPDLDYFCFDVFQGIAPPLPFAWEEVARISCDRNRKPAPEWQVIVGRRLPPPQLAAEPIDRPSDSARD